MLDLVRFLSHSLRWSILDGFGKRIRRGQVRSDSPHTTLSADVNHTRLAITV